MKRFRSFDGTTIAYHDEGSGPAVVLLHGALVDADAHFRDYSRYVEQLDRCTAEVVRMVAQPDWQELFVEFEQRHPELPLRAVLGGLAEQPADNRNTIGVGLIDFLTAHGCRVIAPDARGHGQSDAPVGVPAYADHAMAKDVLALIDVLELDRVEVYGCSMGGLTVGHLLTLGHPTIGSAVLAGIGDWIIEGRFFRHFAIDRPMTAPEVWEDVALQIEHYPKAQKLPFPFGATMVGFAKNLAVTPDIVRGHLASPVSPAALQAVRIPVLQLSGVDEAEGDNIEGFRELTPDIQVARAGYGHVEPCFVEEYQHILLDFFKRRWAKSV